MEETKFASPLRSTPQEIDQSVQVILRSNTFTKVLNLFPEIVLILDKNRQTVYCNQELLRFLGIKSPETILGKRPGELFNCVNAFKESGGCGTSEFCRECGAVNAILIAQTGKTESRECRITIGSPSGTCALDLKVWAAPVELEKMKFTFFVIRDIHDEKRRVALEQVFFHDILNDTCILKTYTENVRDGLIPADTKSAENIFRFSKRLSDEILDQRNLLAAEKGTYVADIKPVDIPSMFRELIELYGKSSFAKNKELRVQCHNPDAKITTDPQLLWRTLGNLLKNALEATKEQGTVTMGLKEEPGQKIFFVNNPEVMTDEVRHQMFQRSFSTKGEGRGLGTYSVKLFTEQYLQGKVWFESSEGPGTTFFVSLPAR